MNKVEKIVIKQYTFNSADVPDEFCGTTIAFLTDIHHGKTFSAAKLKSLIEMTNNLHPDIILLGGDYVDHDAKKIVSFFREAKNLKAPLGVYGVLGNHDRWTDEKLSEKYMKKSGIIMLDNNAVWVERGKARIRIGGVGDTITSTQDIKPMLEGTDENDLMILVTHNPAYVDELNKNKIDLMLCGHTHGGQISFKGKWAPTVFKGVNMKYLTGVVQDGPTTVIVSNGIGTVGIPIRIWAAPQIWMIKLEKP